MGKALFAKKYHFRVVEPKHKVFNNFQRSVPFFTVLISRIFRALSGFKVAHFKAHFHAMTESTSNNSAVNMKIMAITLQSEANGSFGKEKVQKVALFFKSKLFLRKLTLFLDP